MGYTKASGQLFWLQLFVGVFFLFLGILGILPNLEEGFFSITQGGSLQFVEVLIGVVEVAIGVILFLGLFQFLTVSLLTQTTFWAFVLWAVRLALSQVVFKLGLLAGVIDLNRMTLNWWLETLLMLVLLANLWTLHRRYAVG